MPPVAPAGAVIDVGERSVEVRVGFHKICGAVYSKISVHIIYVHTVTQGVVGENIAAGRVGGTALVTRQDPADSDAQGDVHNVVRQAPAVGETSTVAGEQAEPFGITRLSGSYTCVQSQ
jgi:hypothetical protein